MKADEILNAAAKIVSGSRQTTHGAKERSFQRIADVWNATLAARVSGHNAPLSAVDVAWLMVDLKKVRSLQGNAQEPDHYVDAAGYAGLAGELATENVVGELPEVTSDKEEKLAIKARARMNAETVRKHPFAKPGDGPMLQNDDF